MSHDKIGMNAFSDMKIFSTSCNKRISCEHILALYCTQQKDILHLGKWSSFTKKNQLAISMSVLEETKNTLFSSIQEHSKENHLLDGDMRDHHITIVIKEKLNTISHSSFTSSVGCALKESSKEACHLEETN